MNNEPEICWIEITMMKSSETVLWTPGCYKDIFRDTNKNKQESICHLCLHPWSLHKRYRSQQFSSKKVNKGKTLIVRKYHQDGKINLKESVILPSYNKKNDSV